MLKINHIQIPSTEGKHWLGSKWNTTFWVSTCRKLPGATDYLNMYSHNFKFRTKCSKRKFVFHFLKAIYDTWVSGLRAVFRYRPELICINGKRDSRKKNYRFWIFGLLTIFPSGEPTGFTMSVNTIVNNLCVQFRNHQVNSVISLRTSNRPGLMNFYFCVVHLRKSESQGRENSISVRLSHFLHNQRILHKPWAWRRRRYVIFILRCARS